MYDGKLETKLFCSSRFDKVKPAAAQKKQKLIDSLHFHQFRFDADDELQWIKERLPAASATDYGKSLVDAQNLQKKQQVGSKHYVIKFMTLTWALSCM